MTTKREVTERDFRLTEFADANPEDYEFRADGKIVRKDRFEKAFFKVASLLEFNMRDGFEIDEVIERLKLKLNDDKKITPRKKCDFDLSQS